MPKKSKKKTESTYTQVVPVLSCSDKAQVDFLMNALGTVRAVTYNKLGSLQGWGLKWQFAAPKIRPICPPDSVGLDKARKIWEWSVNDTMKAISAQQEAAKVFLSRDIWRKIPLTKIEKERRAYAGLKPSKKEREEALDLFPKSADEIKRDDLFEMLNHNPTKDNWLHRKFRKQYLKGHTFQRNQIVYQGEGYKAKRLSRNTIEIALNGVQRKTKITLKLKCRHVVSGQIRLIKNEFGKLEIHCTRKRKNNAVVKPKTMPEIGVDKGYTEGFYTSNGDAIAEGLGQLLSAKTERQTWANKNLYRLRCHAENCGDSAKAERIRINNQGSVKKSRKLRASKATVKNLIRKDLRRVITTPTRIFAEDLTSPIKGKTASKRINRKLNQWIKGELQDSLEAVAKETGSIVSTVNPAYTSQTDSQTGTLLGQRNGDRFTTYRGVVLQADQNAATNILYRGSDTEISRWMKYGEVRKILISRTVRYLASIETTVAEALKRNWLPSKFKAEALRCEAELSPQGV